MEKVMMRKIKLVNTDGKTLYEGTHPSLNAAIEHAITHSISLDGINLTGEVLHNINLDGVKIQGANFCGADLSGANMSEAEFIDCDFQSADLTQACFCYSNFMCCNFKMSIFSGTDIAMSCLEFCIFEGVSMFHLNFHSTYKIKFLTFYHGSKAYGFQTPPTIIRSAEKYIIIIDNHIISNDLEAHTPLLIFDQNKHKENFELTQPIV